MKKIIEYLGYALLVGVVLYYSGMLNFNLPSISVLDLKKKHLSQHHIEVIDVRTKSEYYGSLGHIPHSKLRPLSSIDSTIEKYKNSNFTEEPLYVICRSGNRSSIATKQLRKHGINAINVDGGMKAWNKL
jgi:sulfur-carrier protein adenylyltransferase/sulfurtransferase